MKFELKVARGAEVQSLTLEASDSLQAQLQAEAQGYSVLGWKRSGKAGIGARLRKPRFNLMLFSQELLSLLDSGLSLVEAIEALAEKEGHGESRSLLKQLLALLYEGLPLSSALEKFPAIFPPLYVALIRSSERTGDMVQALGRHVTYQGQLDAVKKKITTASIYPVLLIVVGGLVMLFLLGYVVPRFSAIYESAGDSLPWMSQLLLAWGRMLHDHGQAALLASIVVMGLLALILSRPMVRNTLMQQLWKIPALGETMRIYQLARFYRTLGMLLQGGIPLVTGMQMVSSLLQPSLRHQLQLAEQDIREGKPLSSAMEEHGMTTTIALRMLRVGERTGRMGEMMERIGSFYDEEIARAVDWFTRLLEPLLMVVIGLIIGVVVVLMYMPIFDLAGEYPVNQPLDHLPLLQADSHAAMAQLDLAKVQQARVLAQQSQQHLLDVLEEISGLDSEGFMRALGHLMRYPVLDILQLYELQPDFQLLPFAEASRQECIALHDANGKLHMVYANPFEPQLYSRMNQLLPAPAQWSIAHRKDIAAFLSRFEDSMRAMDGLLPEQAVSETGSNGIEDISLRSIAEDTSPVVKLVRSTLYDALKAGASDIHMETDAQGLTIKYRIDGVLSNVGSAHGVMQAEQAISRIKVMSELDIAERRIPQDGRFKVMALGREVDMRVSIMPSVFGEDAVLRILDRKALSDQAQGLSLDVLGFEAEIMARFRLLAEEPYGMLLVTGPTGSGKTTTLYGAISEINNGQDKIITIEDPVEYQLPGVLQIPVNEKKGLTFARGLRSILRHDPDKIMVGEIRDPETAQIAVQSALTGHLVLTTVHANNVFDVIGRFTNMNVDAYSFVSAINGIMAQRLVRTICPHCAIADTPDTALLAKSGIPAEAAHEYRFRIGQGCGQCHGTGYKGRKAVAELLVFNDLIRELIVTREPVRKVKEAARANGTRTMREAALDMVKRGETTLQEINRVTSLV